MRSDNLKQKVVSSLVWKFLERASANIVQFIVTIVLARLLLPEYFGVIAIVTVFIDISKTFVQSGFNSALIQKKDADELDFSSIFYVTLFIAIILYSIIFSSSSFIANFYDDETLIPLFRVLPIVLIFGAYISMHTAYLSRKMKFKVLFICKLIAAIVSGFVGIYTAYQGAGVWALVYQRITMRVVNSFLLTFTSGWKLKLMFSFERVKALFSYSSRILSNSLLNTLFKNIRTLIIGKVYTSSDLGYYKKGKSFPDLIIKNIDGSIKSVMFPALSIRQDDKTSLKKIMRRSISVSSYIIFPLMTGLAIIARPMVSIVLTDKWLPCVPYLQLFCIYYALTPINSANLQLIKALGRSDIILRLSIIRKTVEIILVLITLPFGVIYLAASLPLMSVINVFINSYPNRKLLNYNLSETFKDLFPSFSLSIVMGAIILSLNFLNINSNIVILLIQLVTGVIVYGLLSYVLKLKEFNYIIENITNFITNRREKCKKLNK